MTYLSFALFLSLFIYSCYSFIPTLKPHKTFNCFATNKNEEKPKSVPKIGLSNLIQLITMGAGAPGLGEYKRTDENGKMYFELEANNLTDEKGNPKQLKGKYFNDGYTGEDFEIKPPGFWENLMSGGKLQSDWDLEQSKKRK
jgi:hypothetical protein